MSDRCAKVSAIASSCTSADFAEERVMRDSQFIKDMALHYNDSELSDVTLSIGLRTYHAHKFVLAKSSDVLRTMLYKRKWEESGKPEVSTSLTYM